jgi:hypothetical protein
VFIPVRAFRLHPGKDINKIAGDIGNPENTFLNVTNLDAENSGTYGATVL